MGNRRLVALAWLVHKSHAAMHKLRALVYSLLLHVRGLCVTSILGKILDEDKKEKKRNGAASATLP